MYKKFEDKVVLITGGASGIGASTTKLFLQEGAQVVVSDINQKGIDHLIAKTDDKDANLTGIQTDVSDPESVQMMVDKVSDKFGRLDILYNNAYAQEMGNIVDLSIKGWNLTMAVSLTSVFLTTKFSIPLMQKNGGGTIINASSAAGIRGDFGQAAYSAAKAAVINLTQTTAIDFGNKGIRCNCICPGAVMTPALRAFMGESDEETQKYMKGMVQIPEEIAEKLRTRLLNSYPVGRFGEPDEIAKLIMFLASDDSGFINGAVISIDGGMMAQPGGLTNPEFCFS